MAGCTGLSMPIVADASTMAAHMSLNLFSSLALFQTVDILCAEREKVWVTAANEPEINFLWKPQTVTSAQRTLRILEVVLDTRCFWSLRRHALSLTCLQGREATLCSCPWPTMLDIHTVHHIGQSGLRAFESEPWKPVNQGSLFGDSCMKLIRYFIWFIASLHCGIEDRILKCQAQRMAYARRNCTYNAFSSMSEILCRSDMLPAMLLAPSKHCPWQFTRDSSNRVRMSSVNSRHFRGPVYLKMAKISIYIPLDFLQA